MSDQATIIRFMVNIMALSAFVGSAFPRLGWVVLVAGLLYLVMTHEAPT